MKDAEFKALISLLEDEDPNIGEQIEQKLLSMGNDIVPTGGVVPVSAFSSTFGELYLIKDVMPDDDSPVV